jgi:hypothetical protein
MQSPRTDQSYEAIQKGSSDDTLTRPILDDASLNDNNFPSILAKNHASDPPLQASVWAQTEKLRTSLLEAPCQSAELQQHNDDHLQRPSLLLTPLNSYSKKGQANKGVVPLQQTQDQCLIPEKQILPQVCRSFQITKLRDRWWDLLKNRPLVEISEAERVVTSEEEHSSSNDDESFLEHIELPRLQLSKHPTLCEQPLSISIDAEPFSIGHLSLHDAIRQDDTASLKILIQEQHRALKGVSPNAEISTMENLSVVQLTVLLDRPHLLRILLASIRSNKLDARECPGPHLPPLLLAASLSHEECLQLIVASGIIPLTTTDSEGNNLLHFCCRQDAPFSMFKLVWDVTPSSILRQVLLGINRFGRTALHVACHDGRVDLVEHILSTASFSLLSKNLVLQDRSHQTPLLTAVASGCIDAVMSFLMWRGNNRLSQDDSLPCPLRWAVEAANVEMVLLLLEFSDPAGSGYNLTEALRAAIELDKECTREVRVELARVLIESGANPCLADTEDHKETGVELAVEQRDVSLLSVCLDSYNQWLSALQTSRRKDPVLSKQPESFFAGMESRERAEQTLATRSALVLSLFRGWLDPVKASIDYRRCSLALYRRGVRLDALSLSRLKTSIGLRSLESRSPIDMFPTSERVYRTSYHCVNGPKLTRENDPFTFWSRVLRDDAHWTRADDTVTFSCNFLSGREDDMRITDPLAPDVVLVTDDKVEFHVHRKILSHASAKLEAAIRFATMREINYESESESRIPTVDVGIESATCRLFLQHVYHNSLGDALSPELNVCCSELLELLIVAEEFLCPSLAQECEMRLLSADPYRCICPFCIVPQQENLIGTKHWIYHFPGPALCVHAGTALDVLAVAQHVHQSMSPAAYEIHQTDGEGAFTGLSQVSNKRCRKPMEFLLEAAIDAILMDVESIVLDDSLTHQLQSDGGEKSRVECQSLLVQQCLDQMAQLPCCSREDLRRKPPLPRSRPQAAS